jgi:pSer/pThr/pTyr-binding forkhead associated (FHA) protein
VVAVSLDGAPAVLPLAGRREVVIGRSRGNDLVIRGDAHVSRQHARVHWTPEGHEIVDLSSGNGLAVNGRWVSRARLQPGDRIRVGATVLLYRH